MKAHVRHPRRPPLAGLVAELWMVEPEQRVSARRERILPTGRAQVILAPGPSASLFVGPTTRSSDIARAVDRPTFGVSFRPGGAQPFMPAPISELTDITEDLSSLWRLGSLAERLAELDPGPAFDLLEAELVRRFCPGAVHRPALAAGQGIDSGLSAASIADLVEVDRRHLVPAFRRNVGVGPKHYERIRRFGRAMAAIRSQRPPALATLAADLGYADQAHLSREVRHFADVTPSMLLGDSPESVNHIEADKIFKT